MSLAAMLVFAGVLARYTNELTNSLTQTCHDQDTLDSTVHALYRVSHAAHIVNYQTHRLLPTLGGSKT